MTGTSTPNVAPAATFAIPTIDVEPYLRHPGSSEAAGVVEQVRAACSTSGFFQLVGHGVPRALQQQAFAAARTFFELPDEEKRKVGGVPGRGYEVIGTQVLEEGKQPDLKEGFFIGRESPNQQQQKPPYRPFQEPNMWPDASLIPEAQFRDPLLEYHGAVLELALVVMRILASGMTNLDTEEAFADFCRDPVAALRLLHYPPHPDVDDASLVGAGAHTDFGAITLLLQDGNSGLQVLREDTGEWIDVAPDRDAYVVNVGDMLHVWTNGAYRSNVHRVINTSGDERYSMPFFFDGNPDCRIESLAPSAAGGGKGLSFTVEEHLLSRYAASYK